MKKAIILCTVILLAAGAKSFAQDSATVGTKMKKMPRENGMMGARQSMMDSLNLSENQKQQLQTEMASMKQKRADIKNDNSLSDDARMQKMKDLRGEEKKKIQSVLTPEQQAKYEEMMKNRKPKGDQGDQ